MAIRQMRLRYITSHQNPTNTWGPWQLLDRSAKIMTRKNWIFLKNVTSTFKEGPEHFQP